MILPPPECWDDWQVVPCMAPLFTLDIIPQSRIFRSMADNLRVPSLLCPISSNVPISHTHLCYFIDVSNLKPCYELLRGTLKCPVIIYLLIYLVNLTQYRFIW